MPVLVRSCGIVIRKLVDRTFGVHLHAIYGDSELVIALDPLRVIQGDAPSWVREWSLEWVRQHEHQLLPVWACDLVVPAPVAHRPLRQFAGAR